MALRDLWGRRPDPPSPDVAAALADLGRLIGRRPELADVGKTLAEVLRAAFLEPGTDPIPRLDPEPLRSAWSAGVPAFRAALLPLDGRSLNARALRVCEALGTGPATQLASAVGRSDLDLLAWWGASLAGRPETIHAEAESLDLDPALAFSVLRLALLPALSRSSEALAPLRPEGIWERGECPNCASAPALGESRGLEQRRVLRCGLCAADWPGDRLRCPFCGEADHRALSVRYVDGEQDRQRLAHCDTCGLGLKVVSTLGPLSPPGLLVAELGAAHLDGLQDLSSSAFS